MSWGEREVRGLGGGTVFRIAAPVVYNIICFF